MKKIGIDIDDVLANFVEEHKNLAFKRYGKPDPNVLPIDWEMSNYDLTNDEHKQVWKDIYDIPNFWMTLKPKRDLHLRALQELDSKNELYFVTSRAPNIGPLNISQQSTLWLHDQLGIIAPTVIVTSNKGPVSAAIGIEYYIDDRPKNCIDIAAAIPSCKIFLKDTSHNKTFNDPRFPRLNSVNDFVYLIQGEK